MRKFYAAILIGVLLSGLAAADSLWSEKGSSPYSPQKPYKVGDLINVIIMENSNARNLANTKTDVKDDLSFKYSQTFARLAPVLGSNNSATVNLANKYDGGGQTTRGSNVQARFAAWINEIRPNGILSVEGHHKVEVNNELQEITFTGLVRSKDISNTNTVYSYQVANASVSVKGTGSVADSETPGWMTRIINWLF
ncbi:MAG: flagellar basal body L-ring protein FlgH [Candidatus Margulisiibacteriota bacterium]